ncbi:MAG: DUF4143 domain-containing protein [Bdellovibrio sp.]|nr:MAG: DUF4143 domain-containing protein [Bdellovibrio sp.]
MYLPRNIDAKLKKWASSRYRKPLILRGARQVGKSASVAQLGALFPFFLVVDFEHQDFKAVFEQDLDPKRIIKQLEVILGQRIIPKETLLFFDEVQECPRALMSLRYFQEQLPELHVIAAGSLLEFVLGSLSFPVGRVEYEYLYPLSFQEFLKWTGQEILAENLPEFNGDVLPHIDNMVAQKLNEALREYFIVGGMPEAVKVYAETSSFIEVRRIQDNLIQSFQDDIPKYVRGASQIRNIIKVFKRLAGSCCQQVTYSKLLDDDNKRNKQSVFLLEKAMLIHLVRATSPNGLPLGAHCSEKVFKPLFLDIGIAQRISGRQEEQIVQANDLVSMFQGQLAEQFVGQQMLAEKKGCENGKMYYWKRHKRGSTAEVDYIMSRNGEIVPVEVKSGKAGRLKSLHLLMREYPHIKVGLCMQSINQPSVHENIYFLPLYTKV